MPYSLVISKNGLRDEISAVPEGWVIDSFLYWPRSSIKHVEQLRADEFSTPDPKWKKTKCRVKLEDIKSLKEALLLEEQYAHLEDTEDEEKYLNTLLQSETANKDTIIDVNNEFEVNNYEVNITANTESNPPNTSKNDEIVSITTNELLNIIKENTCLQAENKSLKLELMNSVEFQTETKRNFAIMQTQLDKIIELLQNKNEVIGSVNPNDDGPSFGANKIDKICLGNVKFPIETKDQLEELEYKLLEKDVMKYLVKMFSETFGISGMAKISKIGLPLMKSLIQDKLLNQFTWKGIKGSSKLPFNQYIKVRELFYRVAHLADKSCSSSDSDSFIQHSAIKHSGQRIKRHSLSEQRPENTKKLRKDAPISDPMEDEMDSTEIQDKENGKNIDKEQVLCQNKKMDNLKRNQPSCAVVTILSDIKIHSKKAVDIKDKNKIANVSSPSVGSVFDNLINFSP